MKTDSSGRFPAEIERFFETPGGHSLIVRGNAGAGKTTLALEMTEYMRSLGLEPYYLSVRVSDASLYMQFPWLKELVMERKAVVNGKAFLRSLETGNREYIIKSGRKFLHALNMNPEPGRVSAERKGLHRMEGIVEEGGVDDEGVFSMEMKGLFPELDDLYDFVDRNLPRKSFIVVDSIDALSETYGINTVKLISVLQKDLVEGTGMDVVFIRESAEDDMVDYFGDGVISLSVGEFDRRRVRTLDIKKLRGQRIETFRYIYTLENGHFRTLSPYNTWSVPKELIRKMKINAITDGGKRDARAGEKNLHLIEIGPSVDPSVVYLFKTMFLKSSLMKGKKLLWLPEKVSEAMEYLECLEEDGDSDEEIKMFVPRSLMGSIDEKYEKYISYIEGDDPEREFMASRMLSKNSERADDIAFSTSVEAFFREYRSVDINVFENMVNSWVQNGAVGVLIVHSSFKDLQSIRDMADVHIKIDSLYGTSVVYTEKPWSNLYVPVKVDEGESGNITFVPLL